MPASDAPIGSAAVFSQSSLRLDPTSWYRNRADFVAHDAITGRNPRAHSSTSGCAWSEPNLDCSGGQVSCSMLGDTPPSWNVSCGLRSPSMCGLRAMT
jgi:hypothetical protein